MAAADDGEKKEERIEGEIGNRETKLEHVTINLLSNVCLGADRKIVCTAKRELKMDYDK